MSVTWMSALGCKPSLSTAVAVIVSGNSDGL